VFGVAVVASRVPPLPIRFRVGRRLDVGGAHPSFCVATDRHSGRYEGLSSYSLYI
jgi:hypothetical protein